MPSPPYIRPADTGPPIPRPLQYGSTRVPYGRTSTVFRWPSASQSLHASKPVNHCLTVQTLQTRDDTVHYFVFSTVRFCSSKSCTVISDTSEAGEMILYGTRLGGCTGDLRSCANVPSTEHGGPNTGFKCCFMSIWAPTIRQ